VNPKNSFSNYKFPNILFILTDQQRWDAISTHDKFYITNNLEHFSKESVIFENCFTNSPVCIPSRLALATGLYPHNLGVTRNKPHDLPINYDTWMKHAKKNGYYTCAFGKTHLHRHGGDLRDRLNLMQQYGFDFIDEIAGPHASANSKSNLTDFWDEHGLYESYRRDMRDRKKAAFPESRPLPFAKEFYPDAYVRDRFCNFLKQYKYDTPWCAFVGFSGPHEPWDAPQEYLDQYKDRELSPSRFLLSGEKVFERSINAKRMSKGVNNIINNRNFSALRKDYAASVTFLDDLIGDIFRLMQELGYYENTLIIFSSDHGEMNGDYGLLNKQCFFDGAVRVPLIVKPPASRIKRPYYVNHLVSLFDVAATISDYSSNELAPVKNHELAFSRSLRPLVEQAFQECETINPLIVPRDYAVSEYRNELMLVTANHKFMFNKSAFCYAVFDRISDLREEHNIMSSIATRKDILKDTSAAANILLRIYLSTQDHA
tara:strand:- start:1532 stop:2992 length:1461 start_codon:yes stop_codon:yes gene_type:complete